jgi:hypothetical protein
MEEAGEEGNVCVQRPLLCDRGCTGEGLEEASVC